MLVRKLETLGTSRSSPKPATRVEVEVAGSGHGRRDGRHDDGAAPSSSIARPHTWPLVLAPGVIFAGGLLALALRRRGGAPATGVDR